jgi:hypothetical protein
MQGWCVSRVPGLAGHSVEWADETGYVLALRNRLSRCASLASRPEPWAAFPAAAWRRIAARSRWAQRLLRFMFYNVLGRPDGTFVVTFDRSIGVLDRGSFRPVTGLERACRVLRGACAADRHGDVFFGEYIANPRRDAVHVYRLPLGSERVETVHRFAPGQVRHVHGVYFDPFEGSLWCLTGDRGAECRILVTHDGFRTIDTVGAGNETWRAVSILATPAACYYGTDAELGRNAIYRLDRASGAREELGTTNGPVYYSCSVGRDLFFAVTAEMCPSQVDRKATVWHVSPEHVCAPLFSLVKDRLPGRLFLPGTIHFARGPGRDAEALFQAVALERADSATFRIHRVS